MRGNVLLQDTHYAFRKLVMVTLESVDGESRYREQGEGPSKQGLA